MSLDIWSIKGNRINSGGLLLDRCGCFGRGWVGSVLGCRDWGRQLGGRGSFAQGCRIMGC
jgi:hypothetical protein